MDLTDAYHIIVRSSDTWTERDLDLAFTYLNPNIADSIATQSVFLNIEKNRERIEDGEPANCHSIDVMFGLVAEYSRIPVIEGDKFVSPMCAVIYRGRMHGEENGLVRFQTIDDDPKKLPKHFGGLKR